MRDNQNNELHPGDPVIFIVENRNDPELHMGTISEITDMIHIMGSDSILYYDIQAKHIICTKTNNSDIASVTGVIDDAKTVHKRKMRVTPIETHYEEDGESSYIKYSCPVCHAAGNTGISITKGKPKCPLCGVNLNWDRKPAVGDTVVITKQNATEYEFYKSTKCVIEQESELNGNMSYKLRNEAGTKRLWYPANEFSILEEMKQ